MRQNATPPLESGIPRFFEDNDFATTRELDLGIEEPPIPEITGDLRFRRPVTLDRIKLITHPPFAEQGINSERHSVLHLQTVPTEINLNLAPSIVSYQNIGDQAASLHHTGTMFGFQLAIDFWSERADRKDVIYASNWFQSRLMRGAGTPYKPVQVVFGDVFPDDMRWGIVGYSPTWSNLYSCWNPFSDLEEAPVGADNDPEARRLKYRNLSFDPIVLRGVVNFALVAPRNFNSDHAFFTRTLTDIAS